MVDNRRCFPCRKQEHAVWQHARDLFFRLLNSYAYSQAPEFLRTIDGKSHAYVEMATRLAYRKNREKREELCRRLNELLDSDEALDLVPFSEHQNLGEVKSQLLTLRSLR